MAAFEIGGTTQHSGLQLPLMWPANDVPETIKNPSEDIINAWKPVYGYILDEVSFENAKTFETTILALKKFKQTRDDEENTISVMLLGDFCQLPPVNSKYIFINPKKSHDTLQQRAYQRYRSITRSVHLTEEKRYENDSEWGNWLKAARKGIWPNELILFLNNRIITIETAIDKFGENILAVSPDNDTRTKINRQTLQWIAKNKPNKQIFRIYASLSNVNSEDIISLSKLSDDKTGRLQLQLDIYQGQPITIRDNQLTEVGLVNGGEATIEHIQWFENTTFRKPPNKSYYISSRSPKNVFVKFTNCQIN